MTEKPAYPSQAQDRFIVRLPDGMRDRIASAAKRNARSMNSEVVSMLEAAFEREVELEVARHQRAEQEVRLQNLQKELKSSDELLRFMEDLTVKYERAYQRLSDALEDRGIDFPVMLYDDEYVNHSDAVTRLVTLATVIEQGETSDILNALGISPRTFEKMQAAVKTVARSLEQTSDALKAISALDDGEPPGKPES